MLYKHMETLIVKNAENSLKMLIYFFSNGGFIISFW